jgi:hypothetical protein
VCSSDLEVGTDIGRLNRFRHRVRDWQLGVVHDLFKVGVLIPCCFFTIVISLQSFALPLLLISDAVPSSIFKNHNSPSTLGETKNGAPNMPVPISSGLTDR